MADVDADWLSCVAADVVAELLLMWMVRLMLIWLLSLRRVMLIAVAVAADGCCC